MKRLGVWLVGASLVGLVIAFAPERKPPSPSEASAVLSLSEVTVGGHEPTQDHKCQFVEGQRWAWDLTSSVSGEIDLARFGVRSAERSSSSSTRFDATLDVEALSSSVLLARFHHLDEETAAQVGALDSAFLVRVAPDCSLAGFARLRGEDAASARAQQSSIYQLWFAVPAGERAEVQGKNGTGVFSAVVASSRDERGAFAQRRITGYERTWSGGTERFTVGNSLLTVRLGSAGWFDSMEGSESLRGGGLLNGTSRLKVTSVPVDHAALAQASRDPSQYLWEDLLPRAVAPVTQKRERSADEVRQHEVLRRLTFQQALTQFATHVANEPNVDQQWRPMAAYLEAKPEEANMFAAALVHRELPMPMKAVGFMALGKAQVPQARDALLAIHSAHEADPHDRVRSALALAGRGDVGVAFAKQLRDEALSGHESKLIAQNSLLALTVMSGLHPQRDVEVDQQADEAVRSALSAAKTPGELSPVFGAIGNVANPDLLPLIETWSHNPDGEVRAVVPKALRRLPLTLTVPFFSSWLARETYPPVKESIYAVLHHQYLDANEDIGPELAAQAVKDLAAQPLLLTRQSLVRLLGPVAAKYPEVQQALVEQVKFEVGTGSGLYAMIAQYVPGEAVSVALNQMPEFNPTASHPPSPSGPRPPGPPRPPVDTSSATEVVP